MHVVYYPDKFNYSKLNNFGVAHAKGDFYVLMNNDIEVLQENWMEQMLSNCEREEVGVVVYSSLGKADLGMHWKDLCWRKR